MKFELPLMIHPDGGVLVLGRTLMDLGMSAPSESRFEGIDYWDEGDDVHEDICLLSVMKHRDDEDLHVYFTNILEDSPRPEEDACAFSRHMMHEIWTEGMPSDFFLSPKEMPPHKRWSHRSYLRCWTRPTSAIGTRSLKKITFRN